MKRILPILLILAIFLLVLSSLNINNLEKTGKAATISYSGFIGSQSLTIPERIPLTEFIDKEILEDDEEFIEEDITEEKPTEITPDETSQIQSEGPNITIEKPQQGFIIELKEEPILKQKISLEKESGPPVFCL